MALPKGVPDLSRVIIVAVVTCFLVAVLLPNHIIPSLDGGIRNDINALRRRGLFVHKNADSRPEATSLSGSDRSTLTGSRVIPDVISKLSEDENLLTELILVYNSSTAVSNGIFISPSAACTEPTVVLSKHRDSYTLLLTDPDSDPSSDQPGKASELLWLITNIFEGDFSQKNVVLGYQKPKPVKGTHRYVFTLWRQAHSLPIFPPTTLSRTHFDLNKFVKDYNLGEPVAAQFYYSQYD